MKRQKGKDGVSEIDPARIESLLSRTSFGNGKTSFKRVKNLRNQFFAARQRKTTKSGRTWQEVEDEKQRSRTSSFSSYEW